MTTNQNNWDFLNNPKDLSAQALENMETEKSIARVLRGVGPIAAAKIAKILVAEKKEPGEYNVRLNLPKREFDLLVYILRRLGRGREVRLEGVGILAANDMLNQLLSLGRTNERNE